MLEAATFVCFPPVHNKNVKCHNPCKCHFPACRGVNGEVNVGVISDSGSSIYLPCQIWIKCTEPYTVGVEVQF